MDTIIPLLVGHRTQILSVFIGVIQFLGTRGWIDPATADHITVVLAPLAVATLAAKIQRGTPPNVAAVATVPQALITDPPAPAVPKRSI